MGVVECLGVCVVVDLVGFEEMRGVVLVGEGKG